jgi:hypothetical protein
MLTKKSPVGLVRLLPDLPAPPRSVLEAIDLHWRDHDHAAQRTSQAPVRSHIVCQGHRQQHANHVRLRIGLDWERWVADNIAAGFNETGVSYAQGPEEHEPPRSAGIHTDSSRDFSVIWLLDPGGPDAELTLWRDPNQDLMLPGYVTRDHDQGLVNIAVIPGNPGCWYQLHTRVLHSIDWITRNRVGLQISYNQDPWPDRAWTVQALP